MTDNAVYLETLLKYYEDEVMGEAYFYGLADHIGGAVERKKFTLLAKVERRAADVVLPLLKKYGLMPRDKSVLKALGEAHVQRHQHFSWMGMMEYMIGRYPAYLDEFEALERLAPEDDIATLKLLTHHEVVAIDFANKEIALDPNSVASLQEYLDYSIA